MKVIKPAFIHHEGKPIFSCDIHPDGLRFATGGQGNFSGRIAIWNLSAVTEEAVERDENVPKLLCNLDNHLSCVNSVRWSHSGKCLASGGDDKLIMIWTRNCDVRVNAAGVLIGLEQWRCAHTLSGHDSDVLDVAWAPLDARLASCSVDNSVIVWSMDGRPAILARLTGHAGLVKGVAWDPVGEFLASQSDDRSLRLWRTSDWGQHTAITEPFKECGDMTHVLRLNWSPDGQYVVSAHASNCGGPTAQIIERPMDAEKKTWTCDMDFVGHRKAVTCVKFNGNLLKKPPAESKFCIVATGSRDCSIALWSTQQRRPLFVISNVFNKSVLDMSWSADGRLFMACSWDGSVAFFHLSDGELGVVVSAEEKMLALEGLYGKKLLHGKVEPVIEDPAFLTVESVPQEKPPEPPVKEIVPEPPPPVAVFAKQIEIRGVDGRRRITPISVPRDAPQPNLQTFSSSSNTKTKIVVEKRGIEETVAPQIVSAPQIITTPKAKRMSLMPSEVAAPSPLSLIEQRPRQEVRTITTQLLRPLGMEGGGSTPVQGSTGHWIVVTNSKDPPLSQIKRETRGIGSTNLWEIVLGHPVIAVRSTASTTVIACADRSLHVIDSNTGAPKILPLLLPGRPACLDFNSKEQLCIVTACGQVAVWDLSRNSLILRDDTLRSELQTDSASFAMCRLKADGFPTVVLTNGRSFSYSKAFGWQLLADTKTSLWQLSSQKDVLGSLPPTECLTPLRSLLKEQKSASGSSQVRVGAVRAATAGQCSISLLYHQLMAAATLESEAEYKVILVALIRLLAQDGALQPLRALLKGHAEPRGLMPHCLPILKEFLHCQRLYIELSAPTIISEDSLGPPSMDI